MEDRRFSEKFPFPVPNGWFCLGWSHELAPGEVKRVAFCGLQVALFRTEDGQAHALDPMCPHLGADLTRGKVVGDSIQCPFHAWRWNGEGRCIEIPYANEIPRRAKEKCLRSYPLVEMNGVIMGWNHLDDQSPDFEVPHLTEFNKDADDKWGKVHYFDYQIATCLQEIAENDVDQAHFPYVHKSPALPETFTEQQGIYRRTVAETLMDPGNNDSISPELRTKGAEQFTTSFTREAWGLGTVLLRMDNIPPSNGEFVMLSAACPVDAENASMRWQMRVTKDIEDEVGNALIDGIANGVYDDIPIWENKVYRAEPLLCDGDGPINKFRKWVGQFYSVRP